MSSYKNVGTITILNDKKKRQYDGFCGSSYVQRTDDSVAECRSHRRQF
ncbi:hypothetical protein LEP1GSC055_1656 [Leptospira borgpetersenii str. Brem 307]|nr:hypothetical protein LEP1GSC055_1656 [Leptospira borgpetersenii str. Brem 307]